MYIYICVCNIITLYNNIYIYTSFDIKFNRENTVMMKYRCFFGPCSPMTPLDLPAQPAGLRWKNLRRSSWGISLSPVFVASHGKPDTKWNQMVPGTMNPSTWHVLPLWTRFNASIWGANEMQDTALRIPQAVANDEDAEHDDDLVCKAWGFESYRMDRKWICTTTGQDRILSVFV